MESINKSKIIEYAYPDLGLVQIILQDESAKIYNFLQKQSEGIEYFENLDQLGGLRTVHKSAHHSRWEYMILQMYLIQQLKSASTFGFSTSIRLTPVQTVSSVEELLKSWVLLNNYGHLLDTIEAERVWFELILEKPELYKVFMGCMPDRICKNFAKNVFKEEALYKFHHVIALALLGRMKEKKGETTFGLWIEMIKALLRDTIDTTRPKVGSKLERALSIFHKIRRASYTLLDINRSTLFLRIDPNNLLRNILKSSDIFLYDPDSEVNNILVNIERLLFSEVYASKETCTFKYHYINGQKKNFHKLVEKTGIGLFCRNHKVFATQLHQAKINNFGKYKSNANTRHIARLNLLPVFPFERNICHYYTEQQKISATTNVNNAKIDFLVTPTPYSEAGSIIDIFRIRELDTEELIVTYHALIEYIIDCYRDWSFDQELVGIVTSTPLQELFSFIIRAFINNTLRLRFTTGTSPREHHVDLITNKQSRRDWLRRFSKDIDDGKFSKDRDWELRVLRKVISRQTSDIFLVAISNIHLYAPDGTSKVEWDGCFFTIGKDHITLFLIESKRKETRSSQKCSSALLDSIDRAGIKLKHGNPKAIRGVGYAYTKIVLQDCYVSSGI